MVIPGAFSEKATAPVLNQVDDNSTVVEPIPIPFIVSGLLTSTIEV